MSLEHIIDRVSNIGHQKRSKLNNSFQILFTFIYAYVKFNIITQFYLKWIK